MLRFLPALLLLLALPLHAQVFPEYEELYVNDFADLLNRQEERAIRTSLEELRDRRGIEFTIVTIARMTDYGHEGSIESFATRLFNHWGVGDAARNDGVMMLVSRFDRQVRIEVGSGYGTTKNASLKRIIDRRITPRFGEGDYPAGIAAGVNAVIHDLTGDWPGEIDGAPLKKVHGAIRRSFEALQWALYPIAGLLAAMGWWLYRRWSRYRPRRCPVDGTRMQLLAEHWDDQHLKQGQQTEEQLTSVDYDVWLCPACEHLTIEAYRKWLSRYEACRSCGYRTLEGETTVLQQATTSSTGKKRISYSCHNCDDTYAVTKQIPRVSKSTSSSGGSSSFGGGSSSGGGASGSW